jgi:hypothetical protein
MTRLRKSLIKRPSAAMVVAFLAVLIALGAPGYAAQSVRSVFFAAQAGNAKKVDGLRASKRPHPNQLLALNSHAKFPASVGLAGPRGLQGLPGPQGDRGNAGAPGSALAYSVILFKPPDEGGPPVWRIDDSLSKRLDNDVNLGAAGHPVAGVFCFHDLPFTVANVSATPGAFGSSGPFLVQVDAPHPGHSVNPNCPPTTGAAVYVTDPTGTLEDPKDTSDTIYFTFN